MPDLEDLHTPIIQFSSPLYFAEEEDGSLEIDVMRLGSTKGRVSCYYYTGDASGKAGERYEASEGMLTFEDGDIRKSFTINIIDNPIWCTTLEFKICLSDPQDCILGNYLHKCRVKVIDDTPFPSSTHPEVAQGAEAIASVGSFTLFWEYVKLNFRSNGFAWRTILTIFGDQLKNLYLCYKLFAMSYMLNEIFVDTKLNPAYTIDERTRDAEFIGMGYILPMFLLHAWELARARLDIKGHSQCFLQQNLLRKYLNYSEESREVVAASAVQLAVREDCADMAEGYMAVLSILQLICKVGIMMCYTLASNKSALVYALIMPALMLIFAWLRNSSLHEASQKADDIGADMHEFLGDAGRNYNLIADYWQRPKINEIFSHKSSSFQQAHVVPRLVKINNDYFPRWLGPIFIGLYIIFESHAIFSGDLKKGTFVATLAIFTEISADFSEVYAHLMTVSSLAGGLEGLTEMLNLPTDLREWKGVNRKRRSAAKAARSEIMKNQQDKHPFPTDLMDIQFKNVSFWFERDSWSLEDMNLSVPQGKLVALSGNHSDGRHTFLRLLAHKLFPKEGEIFIPTHLRILHVSLEPYILEASILHNIGFGVETSDIDAQKIASILKMLEADKILAELRESDMSLRESTEDSVWSENDELTLNCDACAKEADVDSQHFSWMNSLSYTEKVKVHLARALVMNPEVMVIQRPFLHFNEKQRRLVMDLLRKHVRNRGLSLREDSVSLRRPRTVFFSVESDAQAEDADIVWNMSRAGNTNRETTTVRQVGLSGKKTEDVTRTRAEPVAQSKSGSRDQVLGSNMERLASGFNETMGRLETDIQELSRHGAGGIVYQ